MGLLSTSSLPTWLRIVIVAAVGILIFYRSDIGSGNAEEEKPGPVTGQMAIVSDDASFEYDRVPRASLTSKTILSAGFVVTEEVFNSELMAPYDIFHHSVFRDESHYIEPFIVSESGKVITTFEGIALMPHYSFDNAPPIDILVIPSTNGSMSHDLENGRYMEWLRNAAENATYVLTLCDGAFPLAETGALDGLVATTFPGDRDRFAERYPKIDVKYDARFVHDGKFITSVGGGMSYEPALYLTELLYGRENAVETASGLVWDWNPEVVPHLKVSK